VTDFVVTAVEAEARRVLEACWSSDVAAFALVVDAKDEKAPASTSVTASFRLKAGL
jgi:hypothetical protein